MEGKKTPPEALRKMRWETKSERGRIEIVEDEAFRARLEHFRSLSNRLNKELQRKMEEAHLPYYSWNKQSSEFKKGQQGMTYPKVLRLAILLRPEFYHSDGSEAKTSETRYNTGDDQITLFIHLRDNDEIQLVRMHSPPECGSKDMHDLIFSLMPDIGMSSYRHTPPGKKAAEEKAILETYIREGNTEQLTDFFMQRLAPPPEGMPAVTYAQKATERFQKAYSIATTEEAQDFFNYDQWTLWQSPPIIRNVGKIVLTSILEKLLLKCIERKDTPDDIKQLLENEVQNALRVQIKDGRETRNLSTYIPDADRHVMQTVRELMKVYKPRILGWEK